MRVPWFKINVWMSLVIPQILYLFPTKDYPSSLMMNCLPVCLSVNVYDLELHSKLWSGRSKVKRQETLTTRTLVYSGTISCIR